MAFIGKRTLLQVALISTGFVGAYFLIRAMPVEQCEILHYGQYMNTVGEIEFCGPGETQFYDLEKMRYPLTVTLQPQATPEPGQPTPFTLVLRDYQGQPLNAEDIAVSHTERIHLMAVDRGLEDYQHLHPLPTGKPGEFAFEITPRKEGRYSVYLDFIPLRSGRRVLVGQSFTASDSAGGQPVFEHQTQGDAAGYHFSLEGLPDTMERNREHPLRLVVRDAEGNPAPLEPVMNAWAHLVAFDELHRGLAHLHPLAPYLPGQTIRPPDVLDFVFSTDKPGNYRLWAQVKIDGEELFVPFDLKVI